MALASVPNIGNSYIKYMDNINVITLDKDFKKLLTHKDATKEIAEIMAKVEKFKVPVHPRIHLYYWLLQKGATAHAHRVADSLFYPYKYTLGSKHPAAPAQGHNAE